MRLRLFVGFFGIGHRDKNEQRKDATQSLHRHYRNDARKPVASKIPQHVRNVTLEVLRRHGKHVRSKQNRKWLPAYDYQRKRWKTSPSLKMRQSTHDFKVVT